MKNLADKILSLKGPIVVLGASGFIGTNLFQLLLKHRSDVYGTVSKLPNWRLECVDKKHLIEGDLLVQGRLESLLDQYKPQTIFNCLAYGAYAFENDVEMMYKTNVDFTRHLIDSSFQRYVDCFINAGSSCEYGDEVAEPKEDAVLNPNSHYAITKATISDLIHLYGKKKGMKIANLRLYSVYGPYEDSSRLIPQVVLKGLQKEFTTFTNPETTRDFVYVDDVCEAFIDAAYALPKSNYGESFNIGCGIKTTMSDLAEISKELYEIPGEAKFNYSAHKWDVVNWYSNSNKAAEILGWAAQTYFRDGLIKMTVWAKENLSTYLDWRSTKVVLEELGKDKK